MSSFRVKGTYVVPLWLSLGCASPPHVSIRGEQAYDDLEADLRRLLLTIQKFEAKEPSCKAVSPGDPSTIPRPAAPEDPTEKPSSIPWVKAAFCIHRALYDYDKVTGNKYIDYGLLISAGTAGGAGVALQSAASTMSTPNAMAHPNGGLKKDLEIAGNVSIASAAGLLALRAAMGTGEIARTQRIAAAQSANAAIHIIEAYALADDPKDVVDDGFDTCISEDIDVSRAFPSLASAATIEARIQEAKQAKRTAESEADTARAQAKATAAPPSPPDAGPPRTEGKEPRGREQRAGVTTSTKAAGGGDAGASVRQSPSPPDGGSGTAESHNAAVKLASDTVIDKLIEAAQADAEGKRLAVLKAGAALRRALFYRGPGDVDLAACLLKDATEELSLSRSTMTKLKERRLGAISK